MIVINKSVIAMDSGDSNDCETAQNNRAEEIAAAAAVVLSLQSTMVSSLQQAAMLPINSPAATALNLQADAQQWSITVTSLSEPFITADE
jgi:hypothetical protein